MKVFIRVFCATCQGILVIYWNDNVNRISVVDGCLDIVDELLVMLFGR